MKTFLLIAALAGALVGAAGTGFAQQQPAPGPGVRPATCSQQAAFCKSGCGSYGRDRQCAFNCDHSLAECMTSGFWKNLNTGQMLPRRKE